ncbi:hypothetical protein [Schaalia sp. Marseille-Q2122]|uniref:hypothetical protein n=1 Tax=Schaalia sp. Marseille-Q2122 TaxID=2736604 RepID=UPI00158E6079|nr:hypothetical protein [Schaalia sp. Marseille-Q2122]
MSQAQLQDWNRCHGVVVGVHLDPELVAEALRERGVMAELSWFDYALNQVSLVVAAKDGHVGLLAKDGSHLTEGPTLDELAAELASLLDAEVRIGTALADGFPEEEAADAEQCCEPADVAAESEDACCATTSCCASSEEPERQLDDVFPDSTRIVELSRAVASSVPLFAAVEGVDVADMELADGWRALMANLPEGAAGWGFGDLPTVTLAIDDHGLSTLLVTDDHIEHMSAYDWTMSRIFVGGTTPYGTAELAPELTDLVTSRQDLLRIAEAVPGADVDAFIAAARSPKRDEAWRDAVLALGLPESVVGFLAGEIALDEVEGTTFHRSRGVPAAIGRSVDMLLTDMEGPTHPLWDAYESFAVDRPWAFRAAVAAEAAVGAGLLGFSIIKRPPRSGWTVLAGIVGGLMVVDSIAELSLARYSRRRAIQERARYVGEFGADDLGTDVKY